MITTAESIYYDSEDDLWYLHMKHVPRSEGPFNTRKTPDGTSESESAFQISTSWVVTLETHKSNIQRNMVVNLKERMSSPYQIPFMKEYRLVDITMDGDGYTELEDFHVTLSKDKFIDGESVTLNWTPVDDVCRDLEDTKVRLRHFEDKVRMLQELLDHPDEFGAKYGWAKIEEAMKQL